MTTVAPALQMLDDQFMDGNEDQMVDILLAFAGSAIAGMYSLTGPVVSKILDKCGYKSTCWLGLLIICLNYAATVLLHQYLWAFVLFYGVLNGVGSGLVMMAANTVPALYFKAKKGLGTGCRHVANSPAYQY